MPEPWENEIRVVPPILMTVDEDDELYRLLKARQPTDQENDVSQILLRTARWILFKEHEEYGECLEYVSYSIDPKTGELVLAPGLTLSNFASDDELQLQLVIISASRVPVIADNLAMQARLDALIRGALTKGFEVEHDGKPTRFRYAPEAVSVDLRDANSVAQLAKSRFPSPAEARIALTVLNAELAARDEAGRLLSAMRLGIRQLEMALDAATANEKELQQTLTTYPMLFGPEYVRIIPQHKLGKDFVMDYALVRGSGLVDVVEIEASTHKLYTQKGNPTAALVHAEQQVLDWLAAIRDHAPYFQKDLPELQQPLGFVVIGSRNTLSDADREKLVQRNRIYHSSIQILTYDDLLDRAKRILAVVEGAATADE